MNARLLISLLTVAAALWAMAPAAAAQSGSEEPASGGKTVEDPRYTEPTVPGSPQDPQQQPTSAPADQTTSPGGQAPGSGTVTTGPGAPEASPDGEVAPCRQRLALRQTLRALRRAARGRNALSPRARAFGIRVRPCAPGTFVLTIADARTGVVLWRAERTLRTAIPATLRMTMTRPGRRFVRRAGRTGARRVALRVRATFAP